MAPVAPVARPAAAPPRGGRVAFQDDIGVGRPSPPPLGGAGAIPETSFAASAAPAQGARPKLAGSGLLDAAPHGDETVLRVRPANRTRLAALVERRLQAGEIYLRPDVDVHEGQDVILVLVHHQTDAELALTARVERVVPGRSGARSGVLLAFEPVTPTIERDLLQFVDEGLPTAIVHQGEVARAESDARVAALQAAADERPEDARRWIRLGWALLLANRAAEATTPLQRGMALAPRMPIVPMLLLLAHGLAGDVEGAEALLGGMGADDLLEPLLD